MATSKSSLVTNHGQNVLYIITIFIIDVLTVFLSACVAVHRAKNIARQADIVAALTLEVLRGSVMAYDPGMSLL